MKYSLLKAECRMNFYDSLNKKNILFKGSKGEAKLPTLFDSGSDYSCIKKSVAEKLEIFTFIYHYIFYNDLNDNILNPHSYLFL